MAKYSVNTKSYEGRYLNLTIEQIQNIEKNTSTLNWTLTATGGKSKYYTVYPTTITIDGREVYSKEKTDWDTYKFPAAAGSVSGSIEVEHTSDGSKTIGVYFYTGVYYSSYQQDYGGSFTLDKIPRANSIAVSNYNLGQNISVTIGKKADAFTSTLTYKIGDRTGTLIEKTTESSYVWEMSEELIRQIKQDNPSNAKPSAIIYCDTYSGDTKIGSTQSAIFTLTIIDKPTIDNVVINETIDLIKQYTTSIVKYLSVPQFNISAIPSEGTSIKSYRVKIGDREIISSTDGLTINNIQYSYLVDDVRKTKFVVMVTDERENISDEYPIEIDFIEYVQLAFNNTDIKLTRLNGTSNFIKLHMTGYIYNGLIGETPNTLRMQYQYRLKSDSTADWSDNKSIKATLNEHNTFIIDNLQLEDEFDYRENYEIVFWIQDLFSANYYSSVIKTSETTAKWHKNGAYIKEIDTNKLKVCGQDVTSTDTVPIGAIVEYDGNTIPDGYEEVDDENTYSTEEQVIGTWFGKPLYRKVIAVGSLPNNTSVQIEHNINNVNVFVSQISSWYDREDNKWNSFFRRDNDNVYINFNTDNTYVYINARGTNWSTRTSDCNVILTYTKTTD